MQTDFSWGKAACYIWVLQGKTKLLEWLCTRQSVCKNSTFWVISCDSCTHICQLQQQNQISCSWACWSCRFRPALREGAPSPSGSWLPRTHYPKYSCGAWFLARTWEQEGALWDVQVPSHVLQRNTRAAQTREQIFPTPKKPLLQCFHLKLTVNSISWPALGIRWERICQVRVLSTTSLTNSFILVLKKRENKPKAPHTHKRERNRSCSNIQ